MMMRIAILAAVMMSVSGVGVEAQNDTVGQVGGTRRIAPAGDTVGQVGGTRRIPPAGATLTSNNSADPILLDAPVDRAVYRLGPGDVLDLSVFGEYNQVFRLTVTPEGTVVVPSIGVARVAGVDLNEAQRRVRNLVLRNYRNVETQLTLAQLRRFKVFVVGDVPSPGVQIASAATRVSEVIPIADSRRATLPRNVVLRRASGDTVPVDLVRFRLLGDLSSNPTLREGDALVVPAVDKTIYVEGRVGYPGRYEYRRGESLAGLLDMVTGGVGFPADAADSVRLSRFTESGEKRVHTFSSSDALGPAGQSFAMHPFDAIYVAHQSDYKEQTTATVVGKVQQPGTYPISPGATSVRDLVALAGGFTADASLASATVRRESQEVLDRRLAALRRVPPELLTSEERRLLQASAEGTQESTENVVVDFQKLFAEGQDAYNQPLRAGDTLIVPERRNEVVIAGAVTQPGIVQHVPSQGVDYFVRLAGGYTSKADRGDAVVIKANSGARITASSAVSVDPGDVIVVPFRERRNYLQTLQFTSSLVTTVVGLIVTIRTIGSLF